MLIVATYFKMESWAGISSFVAYLLLSIAIAYLFSLIIIMGVIAGSVVLTIQFLCKSVTQYLAKPLRLK